MFFAFTGDAIRQNGKVFEIQDGFECWNLKKIALNEFVDILKKKIPPVNDNVIHNYKIEEGDSNPFGITEKQYQNCSWGLLIPETLEEGGWEVPIKLNM